MKVLLVTGLIPGPRVVDLKEYSIDGSHLRFTEGNNDVSSSCRELVLSVKHQKEAKRIQRAISRLYRHQRFAPAIQRDLIRERRREGR